MAVQAAPEGRQREVHAAQRFTGVVDGFAGDPHGRSRASRHLVSPVRRGLETVIFGL
jgi:hypothetical protein